MIKQTYVAPEVKPSGTISGRCKENYFLTMPARANHEDTKVGFGSMATHCFPEDSPYTFVYFDYAGMEASVAAMFGEAYNKSVSGTDAFNRAILLGSKEEGTDYHSLTAKGCGVTRDIAKGVNFAA